MGVLDFFKSGASDREALQKLLSLFRDAGGNGEDLRIFLEEDRALRKQVLALHHSLASSDTTVARFFVSQLLGSCAMECAERGDLPRARRSCIFARWFAKENTNILAIQAEVYLLCQDLMAAWYAKRVLEVGIPEMTGTMGKVASDPLIVASHKEIKKRMKEIIRTCSQHPEWYDSLPLMQQCGLEDSL